SLLLLWHTARHLVQSVTLPLTVVAAMAVTHIGLHSAQLGCALAPACDHDPDAPLRFAIAWFNLASKLAVVGLGVIVTVDIFRSRMERILPPWCMGAGRQSVAYWALVTTIPTVCVGVVALHLALADHGAADGRRGNRHSKHAASSCLAYHLPCRGWARTMHLLAASLASTSTWAILALIIRRRKPILALIIRRRKPRGLLSSEAAAISPRAKLGSLPTSLSGHDVAALGILSGENSLHTTPPPSPGEPAGSAVAAYILYRSIVLLATFEVGMTLEWMFDLMLSIRPHGVTGSALQVLCLAITCGDGQGGMMYLLLCRGGLLEMLITKRRQDNAIWLDWDDT
ncbi:hypothetical protein CYMTET_31382, partial [Cymbomonas tetramitiformis]